MRKALLGGDAEDRPIWISSSVSLLRQYDVIQSHCSSYCYFAEYEDDRHD